MSFQPNALYGYDKVGNRLWVRNADGRGDVYKYDSTYQLVGVKYNALHPDAGYDMAQGHTRTATYLYDALGNRTQVVDGSTLTEYSSNNLNQITQVGTNTSFAYDADGNLTGDGTWTYGYDREGRLISATDGTTSVTYSYDAVGRRMSKTVGSTTTQYVYSGQDLIEERDGSGAVLSRYIYAGGIDNPVAVVQGTNTYFYQQDALGNVTPITDSTGAIVESYTYDVFGQPTIKDGDGEEVEEPMQPFLFTGREWDPETGLYHYRTRAYSPELGKFLQADSIGFGGGDMNLYRYVENNPTNWLDPRGLCPEAPNTPSVDDIGVDGSKLAAEMGKMEGVEYCGYICERCVRGRKERYRTGPVTVNLPNKCKPSDAPCHGGDSEIVGIYHNHPRNSPTGPEDKKAARRFGCPIFTDRGKRGVDKWDPNTGRTSNFR